MYILQNNHTAYCSYKHEATMSFKMNETHLLWTVQ